MIGEEPHMTFDSENEVSPPPGAGSGQQVRGGSDEPAYAERARKDAEVEAEARAEVAAKEKQFKDYKDWRTESEAEAADTNQDTPKEEFTDGERKPLSRSQRQQRKIKTLIQENLRLKAERAGVEIAQTQESDDAPHPADVFDETPPTDNATGDDAQLRRQVQLETSFNIRAANYVQQHPEAQEIVETALAYYPPAEHVTEVIMDSPLGPQILHTLAENPDAMAELNDLPPQQAQRWLARYEGKLIAEQALSARQPVQPARRQTQAPPPLNVPKGGATAPKSLQDMSMDEYAAYRHKQEAARR